MTADICARHWDVIVIGTGVGGGTAGRRLAEKGLSVLFLEKGLAGPRSDENVLDGDDIADPALRLLRGAWPDPVRATIAGSDRHFFAPIGAGVGGSSVFYAATLERPEPHDLDHSAERPHPAAGWPVSFAEMLPYFDAAEKLFHVHGQPDPLAAFPSSALETAFTLSEGDAQMMARMRASGLHPYQLHSALRHLDGCQSCLGRKCPRDCKMDGRSAGVEPALATGRAVLLDRCEVSGLRGETGRVSQVLARRDGEELCFTAAHVVLAAGALSSPRLLLDSRTPYWPAGCGNDRQQVGRHLMFHLNEIFALWPPRGERFTEAAKAVGFRDLYYVDGERFGMVQAMGLNVGRREIQHYLRMRIARSAFGILPGVRQLARPPAILTAWLLGQAKVFVGLLEDLPDARNRVRSDPEKPGGILIEYDYAPELLQRRQKFRRLISKALKGQRNLFLNYEPEPNFGHPCGTLRIGSDPASSVADHSSRIHGISNLWVADASFMPTSMGVNPSLTIAANALRVADAIMKPC